MGKVKFRYRKRWWLLTAVVLVVIWNTANDAMRLSELDRTVERQTSELQRMTKRLDALQTVQAWDRVEKLMEEVREESSMHKNRELSKTTIHKLIQASEAFEPYSLMINDSLDTIAFSKERGMLLQSLLNSELGDSSMTYLLQRANFEQADLQGAELCSAVLDQIKLNGANLRTADLSWTSLRNANLNMIYGWNANFFQADLRSVNLEYADLRWASLNESVLDSAKMLGIKARAADVRNASLCGISMRWANCNAALFDSANFADADCHGTSFRSAGMTGVNASDANFGKTILSQAVINGINLNGVNLQLASVENDRWLKSLDQYEVIGLDSIRATYQITKDPTKRSSHRLEKR